MFGLLAVQIQSDRDPENGQSKDETLDSEVLHNEMLQAEADKRLEDQFEARERGEASDEEQNQSR